MPPSPRAAMKGVAVRGAPALVGTSYRRSFTCFRAVACLSPLSLTAATLTTCPSHQLFHNHYSSSSSHWPSSAPARLNHTGSKSSSFFGNEKDVEPRSSRKDEGPLFSIDASRIRPLPSPSSFYSTLREGVAASSSRITLATLYLGTGKLEQELVTAIRERMEAAPNLKVAVQMDLCRGLRVAKVGGGGKGAAAETTTAAAAGQGSSADSSSHKEQSVPVHERGAWQTAVPADAQASRGEVLHSVAAKAAAGQITNSSAAASDRGEKDYISSAQHLLELYRELPTASSSQEGKKHANSTAPPPPPPRSSRVRVGLTLMPQLRGLAGRIVPPRFIEAGGVFHLKAYVFDNHTVVLSGANLSTDYFTNRQDRYVVIGGKPEGREGGEGEGEGQGQMATSSGVTNLATYLHSLVDSIATLPGSHILLPDGVVAHVPLGEGGRVGRTGGDGDNFSASVDLIDGAKAAEAVITDTSTTLPIPSYDPASTPAPLHAIYREELRRVLEDASYKAEEPLPPLPPLPLEGRSAAGVASGSGKLSQASVDFSLAAKSTSAGGLSAATSSSSSSSHQMCVVAPRLQMGSIGVRHDERATLALLRGLRFWPHDVCHVATGYFNLTRELMDAIVGMKGSRETGSGDGSDGTSIHIVTAAPEANGFFGARGIAGAIPLAYSEIERLFYEECGRAGRIMRAKKIGGGDGGADAPAVQCEGPGVAIYEYCRPGWTFHGKGLWLVREQEDVGAGEALCTSQMAGEGSGDKKGESRVRRQSLPTMATFVGSPNFGERSTERDLELQFAFVSRDPAFVDRFSRERDALFGGGGRRDGREGPEGEGTLAHVYPVGPHLGPEANVWGKQDRQIHKLWSWSHGVWIHIGRRILAPFF